ERTPSSGANLLAAGSPLALKAWRSRDLHRRCGRIPPGRRAVPTVPMPGDVRHRACRVESTRPNMLRITVQPQPDRIRLKLEGDLAGIWVSEVEDSWRATRDDRPLYLDLTGVEHIDRAGRYLLGLLHCSGAHLIASGISTTELVRKLEEDWPGPR